MIPTGDARTPGRGVRASEASFGGDTSSLQTTSDASPDDDHDTAVESLRQAEELVTCHECRNYYAAGLEHGIALGRRQADDEAAAIWAQVQAVSLPAALRGIDRPHDYGRVQEARRYLAEVTS